MIKLLVDFLGPYSILGSSTFLMYIVFEQALLLLMLFHVKQKPAKYDEIIKENNIDIQLCIS